jgi:Tol biopolymer transport system component
MRRARLLMLGGVIVMLVATAGAQVRADVALRAAVEQETVKGDLKGAIEAYRKIADGYPEDRAVRAQALVRMADAYRKLGDAQAKQVYERVIKEFADQKEQVTIARARMGQPATDGSLTARRVWTLPAGTSEPTDVSADGRFLSYLADGDLVIRDLAGTGRTHLIKAGANEEIDGARLSRDGTQVAFSLWNNTTTREELYVSRVSTPSPERRPLESNMTRVSYADVCDWTPDGTRVAAFLAASSTMGAARLVFFSVADGRLEEIHALSSIADTDGGCAISPDGRYIAYHGRGSSGAADIFVTTLNGRRAVPAVVHRAEDRVVGWTPTGDALVFSSRRSDGSGLWLMRVTDGAPVGEAQFLTEQSGDHQHLGITAAGTVFSSPRTESTDPIVKVGAFDFSIGQWRTVPAVAVDDEQADSTWQADWSPDGQELSYARSNGRSATTLDVVFRPTDPQRAQRVVTVPLRGARWLRWTNDGSAVLLYGMHPDGTTGFWKIGRDSSEAVAVAGGVSGALDAFAASPHQDSKRIYLHRQFADGSLALIDREWSTGQEKEVFKAADRAGYPLLSPDGRKLYYSRTLGKESERLRASVVVERDMATNQERELSGPRNLGGMNLSPDGRYIATGSNDPAAKTRSFVLIPTAGGDTRTLMNVPVSENWLANGGANPLGLYVWAPDSRSMILRNDGTGELWWVPIDGTAPRKVSPAGMGNVAWAGAWRIHPDGTRVAFHSSSATPSKPAELWMIENVLPGPRK